MNVAEIKVAKELNLKPNKYFSSVEIPWLYQKKASLIMYARRRMVLGDDVGVGKTLESIVAFSYMKSKEPDLACVVFTEKSALIQWKKEIAWLAPALKVRIITTETHPKGDDRRKALKEQGWDVTICTYYTVYNFLEPIMDGLGANYCVIADECNYFKNSGTKMFKQVRHLCEHASRAYGLSATVIENRLDEAYCILRVIAPGTIPSRSYFEKMFCVKKRTEIRGGIGEKKKIINTVVGYKNIARFKEMIEPVFFGRLQTDPEVEQDLPEDIHKNVEVQMSREQSIKYLEAETGLLQMADDQFVQLGVLSSLTVCQQLANAPALKGFNIASAKEEALIENLLGSLSGEKVVIFSKFRTQIDRLEVLIKAQGLRYRRITGAENKTSDREAARVAFQTHGEDGVEILLITKAGHKALNMQEGGHMIMFDLPWSYGTYRQLVGRLKRTGSKHKHIGIYRYMSVMHPDVANGTSTDTIDHHVLNTVLTKKNLFNAVLGDDATIETTTVDLMDVYKNILRSRGKNVDEGTVPEQV